MTTIILSVLAGIAIGVFLFWLCLILAFYGKGP